MYYLMRILQLLHKVQKTFDTFEICLFFFLSALSTLKTTKGYALADILTELHRYVHKSKNKISKFLKIIFEISS
jgi:hypothetical protein